MILARGYICTEPIHLYRTDTSVQNRYICTEPIYLYRTGISVQNRYICTEPIYLYRTDTSVQNRYICTEPIYLYRTEISVQNRSPDTPLNCMARPTFRGSNTDLSQHYGCLHHSRTTSYAVCTTIARSEGVLWTVGNYEFHSVMLSSQCRTFITNLVQNGDSYLYTDRQFALKFFDVLTCEL
jgi:hypothetical protein